MPCILKMEKISEIVMEKIFQLLEDGPKRDGGAQLVPLMMKIETSSPLFIDFFKEMKFW